MIWLAVVVAVPPKVQVLESVAVFMPVLAGFARTTVSQLAAVAKSLTPQVFDTTVKSVVLLMVGAEQPVAVASPELVRVKV